MTELSVNERIKKLREVMKKNNIDIFFTCTSDFHNSEYIQDYFREVYYITGFSGSNGSVVITEKEAYLYTDGRYFIQAAKELSGSEVILMKMGEKDVLKEEELIKSICSNEKAMTLSFDGRMINSSRGRLILGDNENLTVRDDINLLDFVWEDRPKLIFNKIFKLDDKYSGETANSKVERVREYMNKENADTYILTSLCDIAWLLNIRGSDIHCNPVFFGYVIITDDKVKVFADDGLTKDIHDFLDGEFGNELEIKSYNDFYEDVRKNCNGCNVLVDASMISYRLYNLLNNEDVNVIDKFNVTSNFKAIKNETELNNTRKAHVADGVAVTKFIYWLKNNIGKIHITEKSAEDKLYEFRKMSDSLIDLSFDTISAYKANAAMMHYEAGDECAVLKDEGMLLVDSGGHYLEGTTDITRTIVLGKISDKEKMYYTLSLKGMLNLSAAKFLYGCSGLNLDILARGPLWNLGMDYKCGTGHGVGHILSVHEGPNGFRWRKVPERNDGCVLEEGMITTIEPGVYIENEFGIRIENELICKKSFANEYGQFMEFETITFCPVDLEAVDLKFLDERDKELLNTYNEKVYETISPYLNEEEKIWLKHETRRV